MQNTEDALLIRRAIGDKWVVANSLNNLGNVYLDAGRGQEARESLEEALLLLREVGNPWGVANSLNNLGNIVRDQKDYKRAFALYAENLTISHDFEDKWSLAYLLEDMGKLAADKGNYRLVSIAVALRDEIGAPLSAAETEGLQKRMEYAFAFIEEESRAHIETAGKEMPLSLAIEYALADQLQK